MGLDIVVQGAVGYDLSNLPRPIDHFVENGVAARKTKAVKGGLIGLGRGE